MYVMQADTFKNSSGTSPIAIASAAVVYTKAQKIGMAGVLGLSAILSSTNGTPNVKIEMEVSDTAPDALEGVADSSGTDWCIQEGGSPIFTALADKVLHKITINPTPCQYIRLKITGAAANQSDTTGVFKITTQQQLGR